MSYTETGEEYTYFTDEEDELIQQWFTDHGYTWWQPTLCGRCCGYFADEYVPNGIGGSMKENDVTEFRKFAEEKSIDCTVDFLGSVTASSNI